MKQIKGPALFLAQFAGDEAPFNSFEAIVEWASSIGYKGVQVPTWDGRLFDLEKAANDKSYCDDLVAIAAKYDVEITELSTHVQGQLVACHPAYDTLFNGFGPDHAIDDHEAKEKWATEQLMMAAKASGNFGLTAHVTFPGALLWHTVYPWPQRPKGLVEKGFAELARRWLPILNAFDEVGCDVCYELHPGEDLHDGVTF
ncbi:MAG: TIM barrel protein, partial [Emcibacteraceae bacterium]|nr:TIM barrel protein [Emcibacteraceae bacterium]